MFKKTPLFEIVIIKYPTSKDTLIRDKCRNCSTTIVLIEKTNKQSFWKHLHKDCGYTQV